MIVILRRLWSDPVYLGLTALVGVSIGAAFALSWTGEQVAIVTAGISALTGASYELQRRKP
jgi:hypothetical protein